MKFFKKFVSLLLAVMCVTGMMVPAHAANDIDNATQQELNETMSIVMDYLNDHQDISLERGVVQEYEVPIAEDQYVNVTVRNEQVPTTRSGGASGFDRNKYDVVEGMSYDYTLTISNFYLFSGKIIYKVNYTVKDRVDPCFHVKINSVNISATPPATFSLISTYAVDKNPNVALIIASTYGYAIFKGLLGDELCMMVEAKFSGFVESSGYKMIVDYKYYDLDDVDL